MKKRQKKLELVIIASLIVALILLACLSTGIYQNGNLREGVKGELIECSKDSDCIIVRGSCCSCEEGGAPKCIAKTFLGEYTKQLESCSKEGSCIGIDCGKISCGCANGRCIGQPA